MANYKIVAEFDAQTSTYIKKINEAKNATDDFSDSQKTSSNNSKSFGTQLSSLASKATALATTLGLVKAATAGITYNATMEQYQTSFEVMTGSAEEAANTVERLQKIAAETPFEMPDLAETTQLLMNYGFTADEAINRMQMLGDISQGSADKMNRIATAYGQMSSAGKVSLEDIKQMIEAGFNPLQEISETTGESMSSLYDRISKGTISIDEITASMERSTSEGGKYFQSMEKQSQTLNGQLSTLQDNVNSLLGDAMRPFTDFLTNTLLPIANEVIGSIDFNSIAASVETLIPLVTTLGTIWGAWTIGTKIQGIVAGFQQAQVTLALFTSTTNGASIAQAALNGTLSIGETVVALLTGKMTLAELASAAWTKAQTLLNTVLSANPIAAVITVVAGLVAILVTAYNNVEWFRDLVDNAWAKITEIFQKFDDFLTGVFETDWSESFGAFGDILNGFFANVSNIWNSIKTIFSGIIDFITGVFSGDWSKAWEGVKSVFKGIWDGLSAVVKAPINGVIALINGVIDGINSISVDIPDWVPIFGGNHIGFNLQKIGYLAHGTDNWQGGFAIMNEGGRGELVNLPDGSQVIPHDISVKYAKENARANSVNTIQKIDPLDGVTIKIDNFVDVDGTPLYVKSADFTIRKMGNQYKAQLAKRGV